MIQIHPLMPWWLLAPLALVLLGACVAGFILRRGPRLDWARRTLMVLAILAIALRPVTSDEQLSTERMNANVIFVVDRTGSMAAEDYASGEPRLEGVKSDMREILDMTAGSRYAILSFDSTASSQLPLTTDASAVTSWIDTLEVEPTAYSEGSNVDRPRAQLQTLIEETKENDPESSILVYVLTDGENTDGEESESFAALAPDIDGGGVLGYGTAEGGRMKINGGEQNGEYIQDPAGGDGRSVIDQETLRTIATDLGVDCFHRTEPGGLEASLDGVTLSPIPMDEERPTPSFTDWYWIPAIILSLLATWEIIALTLRMGRPVDRADLAHLERTR